MADLFNHQAADASVAGVLSPGPEDLSKLLRGWGGEKPLLVCGGGTTSRCAATGLWTLDLRPGFDAKTVDPAMSSIRIGAGCRMGEVLDHLASHRLTVPGGLSGWPGLGYVLTGGIGPLARTQGLAVDRLLQIRGVWGSGDPFVLERSDDRCWRALCGAAPFLAVVTEVSLATSPLCPLWIDQGLMPAADLPQRMALAERAPEAESLQWHWADDEQVRWLAVAQQPSSSAVRIEGLHQLPSLAGAFSGSGRLHGEVIGLLGPAAATAWSEVMPTLTRLMRLRPHPGCTLSAQQLGGATARVPPQATAFVHRDAVWKPWITAMWPAGDAILRKRSLAWLEQLWAVLEPICPGVHLAQLHHHLLWHRRELRLAFGDRLEELRDLKARLDPNGNLPAL
ncbi:hypothetical protein KR100_06565 [Synechococcus sp. KORDI-100]|uniref:FAD-binding oxidoreductase n=1 Tax=Synechococcus sp. KORDI-100 TaxID=1280380 RepID=UPI0004E0AE14|nr:FAD-binding protein [Synechococcus sp. KORDI-100]AII43027.1 hypothetical protein KR100_06565 [Synechococcus sp. KORDI-100]